MMCLHRLFGFSLILFIIQVDGVQIGAKPPLLVCHVPLELKIFADSSYQASSADLKSCTLIVLSSVNVLFLSSSNASLASVMTSEKRSLQLLKQQTPEAAFSFSLRSTNTFPAIRHLRTIFNGTSSVALLIEFLKANKLTSFDIAWDLIQSTPDYVPKLKTLKTALAKEGFHLTTTIGVEVYNTDALHVSKIAAIVDHIFLVPSYNRHYSGTQYPLADKKLEQAFDTLQLNEGVFLKLYSSLNLSWTKIVVGLSLQTLVWKLNGGATIVGTQFNQHQAILHLQNYYESCKNVNSTWRLRQQTNPFYKLAVAPTNDQWMIHIDPFTLGRRVDLLRQYGFGGVALYDYYQDDFAGVCNANGKVYPLIHQAGLSIFNNSNATPFPEIDPNGGLCIPFLGLTSECKGIFNFGTPKLNSSSSSFGSTSSTTSSSVTVTKITVPVEKNPTTTRTSSTYSSENNVTTPSSSPSTTVTTALPVSRGSRMSDAENVVRLRRSSVSSEGTEPSFSYVNSPGLASTDLDFPSTLNSEIKLPAAESLVTTSVSVNSAIEAFLTKVEPKRDDQTRLSGVTETSALNQTDDSNVTFDQDILQPTLPNTIFDAVPTTSLPLKKSKAVTVRQALNNETERATDIAIVPTIPSVEAEVTRSIQVETEPTSTNDFKGLKSIDEITKKSAALHEAFTEITSLAVTEGDTQKFTGQKSTDKVATDVTNPVNENISASRTEQPSFILKDNENTIAPAETETSISTSRPSTFGNQQSSGQNSGSVGDLMEQTTSKFLSLSSDAQQDWTSQIPLSTAFEIFPTAIKMESLNVALTTEQSPKDDAFSSEKTSASGYQGTVPTVPPSSLSSEQFTMSEFSSVPAEMSTESNPLSEGFPSTIKLIASPTDLVSAIQDSGELSTERFSRSSMPPIDETQPYTDFHLTSPKVPMDEDFSKKTDYDPTTAIDSIDTYYSTEHQDTVSTSQKYYSTNENFSTTNAEILETESSIASERLSPTTRIPTIMESSTETEHYLFSSSSPGLAVSTNTIQPVEPSEDNFSSESSLAYYYLFSSSSVVKMSTESNPTSEGFPSTIKSIASPTDLVSATQDTVEFSTERFSLVASSMAPIDETQSSTDFHLTSPKVPMDEDFSKKTDYDPTTAIDSIDTYYSTEHQDTVSTVSSQKFSNDHSTNENFSTTNTEILETESSIASSERLSPTTRIPTIMESSTETEHYLFSSSSVVKMSTESNPTSEGFPSTIKSIASPTDLVSATQDTGEFSTERFSLVASSTAPIDEAQSSTDFHLTSSKVTIDEDFSKTDYDPMSTAAIDSIDTDYSTEHQDTVSTVSSQKYHSTIKNFSTTNAEILETESSISIIASDRLSQTTGIPTIMESSTEITEHYLFSSSSPGLAVSTNTIQPVEPSEDNFSSESSLAYSASPYYWKATGIPIEVDDVSKFSSQSSEQFPVSELLSLDAATSTEGSLSSDLFSPTFESIILDSQVSSSTFFNPNIMDLSIQEQLLESSSPNSPTSIEETDIDLSTSPTPLDASTEDTQLLSNENGSSTSNFSVLENSQSEITSPQPEGSTIQPAVEETSPTESTFYSTSFDLDTSLTHTSDIYSTEYQDEVSTLSHQGSSHQQMAISELLSTEFAETSPQGSTFEPTLLPNLVDTASTFIIPDMVELSTENFHTSTSENLDQETNLSTTDLPISTVDSQLVNSEIYPTTIASLVDLPNSSSLPFVTDAGDDNAPLIDTLNPTENEFASPREESLFSSVEADFSTSSYVSHKQTLSPVQSSSLVTTDSAVSPPIDTSTEMNGASTSFDLFISATNSPHFSEVEIGSGEESNEVSNLAPIFENAGSGEDVTSTLEENITPGFLNATDKPETSTSEIDSTVSPLTSSIADSVPEASTRHDVTAAFSVEFTSPKVVKDAPFVQQLEENSSTKLATISTEISFASTSPTISDIPSTEVSFGNTFLRTHSTDNGESESKSFPTFSSSSISLSTQSFTAEVVTGSSVLSSENSNKMTHSTGAWSDTSSESPFVASTSTDSTSSTSTTNVATSNTSPNSTLTKQWIDVSAATTEVPSIAVSSSNFTALSSTSSSTISHSTSLSSIAPNSTTAVKSISTATSLRTTTFSPPHSEIPSTTTEIPLVGLWKMLISKLNLTNGLPFSGEYSFTSNFFSSINATSFSLSSEESENMKETLSSITSSPNGNTVPAGNLLVETRPYWLINRPNTEAPSSFSTSRSPPKETNRPPQPVSRTTSNSLGSSVSFTNLFETRPYWLQGSFTSTLPTSMESSITSSTKALHTSAFELRPLRTTETPPSSAQSVTRSPCAENCPEESTQQATDRDSSVVLVAKDVANNVVVHLNVNAYMGDKKLNSSFNFEKWLEDLNRFLSSPSTSSKPHTDQEIKPSPMCQAAGNSILLKSLFCSNESLSTDAEKMRFHNLLNLTRRLAPAIIANLTTAMNLTEVAQTVNEIELLSHQPNAINETSTESVVSLSTESSTAKSTVIEQQNSTSFFDSQNGLTTLVSSNLSDVPLTTVLNGSLESFMLNLTELLKDAQTKDLISAVNQLNHAIPEGFLENLIQSNHSEDAELFNQSAAGNDVKDADTTQVPSTSTFSATAPVEYDIFQKNFWITNRRNPVRKLQRIAGPGLGIIPSIRVPLRTTAKPVSNIFSFLAKPAARRQ